MLMREDDRCAPTKPTVYLKTRLVTPPDAPSCTIFDMRDHEDEDSEFPEFLFTWFKLDTWQEQQAGTHIVQHVHNISSKAADSSTSHSVRMVSNLHEAVLDLGAFFLQNRRICTSECCKYNAPSFCTMFH